MLEKMEIILLAIEKKIKIYTGKGNWQLDNTNQIKIMTIVLAIAVEVERNLISQRTKKTLLLNGSKQSFIANRYGATEATLSNWI